MASSLLFISGADAAGLGKLTVLSALGQPLRAEIELTSVTKDDIGNLVPKLASQEAYRQANVGYNSSLNSLSFSIEERGARRFVLVTSNQAVSEPFLEILVELNSSSGKLIREYTLLLDPVEMQANNAPLSTSNGTTVSSQPNVTVTPLPQPQSSSPAKAPAEQASSPAPATAPKPAVASAPTGLDTYQIKTGDTLSKIANQYKPQGVSLEQMLVALQRSNSAAFIDNNMNLLRSGKILTIPDVAAIDQTNQSEAKKIVLAQSNDFYNYRNKLATQVEQAKPEKAAEPKKSDSGKITAKVEEAPTPVNDAKDKLKLSKAQQQKELADKKALEEEKIARQRALDDANARVKELEANTAKLQNILDLKNKAAAKNAAASAPAVTDKATAAPAATEKATATPAPVLGAPAPSSLPTVEAGVTASKPVIKPKPKVAPAPEPAPEPGITDILSKYSLYIGAGLLLVLGVLGLVASKRKKKSKDFDDESILTGSSIKTNSLFGSTGGQSVDTNNSVFNSNFAPSASQLDANEVDPVAEADVYIAYGRDEQAEEILKEALRTQPDRQAVRVKLLEIYAHRKDTRTFETVASELYGMTGGEGPEWAQAASLGIIIDPQNPLYAGGQASNQSPALGASTLPVESLDPEALLGNSLSQEMLDSLSAKTDIGGNSMLMGGDVTERTHRGEEIGDSLDFDLGLSTNPSPDDDFGISPAHDLSKIAAETAEMPALDLSNEIELPAEPAHEHMLDFPASTPSAPPVATAAKAAIAAESIAPVPAAPAAEEGGGMDFAALDFDFDIPKSKSENLTQVETKPLPDDIPMHDTTLVERTGQKPGPSLDYDLSSIDLNLPKADEAHDGGSSIDFSSTAGLNETQPLDLQDTTSEHGHDNEFNAEMATKLDLAVAYQEIGDKDGARELLEEVLKGGTQEQIERAKTLMHELA